MHKKMGVHISACAKDDEKMAPVKDNVRKDGPEISGTVKQIVIVHSDGGYGPASGHRGNGTVTRVFCR